VAEIADDRKGSPPPVMLKEGQRPGSPCPPQRGQEWGPSPPRPPPRRSPFWRILCRVPAHANFDRRTRSRGAFAAHVVCSASLQHSATVGGRASPLMLIWHFARRRFEDAVAYNQMRRRQSAVPHHRVPGQSSSRSGSPRISRATDLADVRGVVPLWARSRQISSTNGRLYFCVPKKRPRC